MRQPASENSFTVACPMPREAPVNTMVFCSTAGRSSCGDTPGKGQSTVFSSGNPARIAVKVGIAAYHCAINDRNRGAIIRKTGFVDFPTRQDLHDPGQSARSGFSRTALPDRCSGEANLGAETGACRFSDTARYIQYKVREPSGRTMARGECQRGP